LDISIKIEETFINYIKEQTEEYVEKGFISEDQRQRIIGYHEEKMIRKQEIRRRILNME
jgi:hypothetical protein